MTNWIDIAEYASKYKVSQSTLRRRIRNQTIPFKMERGKSYIEDSQSAIAAAPLFSRHKIQQSTQNGEVRTANSAPRASVAPRAAQNFASASGVFDPVNVFLGTEGPSAQHLQQDLERLQKENVKLQRLVDEQQTLIQALEAELGVPA